MYLLFFLIAQAVANSTSPYIIIDGCPEKNHYYDSKTDPNPIQCRNWESCNWDMGMCPNCDNAHTPGPAPKTETGSPGTKITPEPTYISTMINEGMRPSDAPSSEPTPEPSGVPSDVPSSYPTWIGTKKTVRCPHAVKVTKNKTP